MCLSVVEVEAPAKGIRKCFKVMRREVDKKLLTPCFTGYRAELKPGKWSRDPIDFDLAVEESISQTYKTGFHACKTLEDAKMFMDWLREGGHCLERLRIYEAELDGITAEGIQRVDTYETVDVCNLGVLVGRRIKLGKEVVCA